MWRLSAGEMAAKIRRREVSSREVTEACLARMAAVNPAVNAVALGLDAAALEAADRADRAVAAGDDLGILHGVPVTIKENVDMAGVPTVNGVTAFLSLIPNEDSPVVRNLVRSGAVVIGRTNTPAFSLRYTTDNAVRGRTLNPWSRARTPGGSSGGAAAAVATGIGPLAHGNDYGGSIRYPAYCCGVTGLRPTIGRVPAYNPSATVERVVSAQLMSVQGPLARRVADLRLGLQAMAPRDPHDPWWVPAPLEGPPVGAPITVALATTIPGLPTDRAVAEALVIAGHALEAAGYRVEVVPIPAVTEPAERAFRLMAQDIRMYQQGAIRALADDGGRTALDLFVGANQEMTIEEYGTVLTDRNRYLRDWLLFLERYPVVVLPVSAELPFPHGFDVTDLEMSRRIMTAQSPLVLFNYLGLPAASVPAATVPVADTPGGIPVGVQVVAGRYREDLVLAAAEAIEAAAGCLTPIDPRP